MHVAVDQYRVDSLQKFKSSDTSSREVQIVLTWKVRGVLIVNQPICWLEVSALMWALSSRHAHVGLNSTNAAHAGRCGR